MSDERWEEQFKQFLRKTGEDFRRASDEVKAEAQRLLDAAMDPERQKRVRDRLNELTVWARKTAEGVAGAVHDAASKAETAFQRATDRTTESPGAQPTSPTPARKPAAKKASSTKARSSKPPQKKGGKRKG